MHSTIWTDALDAFREHLAEAGRRPRTWRTHVGPIRRLADEVDGGPWEVTARQLAEWLSSTPYAAATRLSAVAALRSFYGWAHRSGRCATNPALEAFPPSTGNARVARGQDVPATWTPLIESWTTYLTAAGRRSQTIRLQRVHVGVFARRYVDPGAVVEADVLAYLAGSTWAPETRKSVRTALRSFYGWAASRGHVPVDPTAALPAVRVPSGTPHPAPERVLEAALKRADDKTRLMVLLAAYAGLRRAEIAQVHPARDLVDGGPYGSLRVTGKGGRSRTIPLHPLVAGAITAELELRRAGQVGTGFRYRNAATADGYLFPAQRPGSCASAYAVGTVLSAVLGEHHTAHGLRHRFASSAYAATHDIRAVGELLGHSKPETTMRYTAVPDGAKLAAVLAL